MPNYIHPDCLEDALAVAKDRIWTHLGWLAFVLVAWLGGGIMLFREGIASDNPGLLFLGLIVGCAGLMGSPFLLITIIEYRGIIKGPTKLRRFICDGYFHLTPWDD